LIEAFYVYSRHNILNVKFDFFTRYYAPVSGFSIPPELRANPDQD